MSAEKKPKLKEALMDTDTTFSKTKKTRRIWVVVLAVFLALVLITGVCVAYLSDYYRADDKAIKEFLPMGSTWSEADDGRIVFEPEGATKGFIFYPGGKVDHTAYIPLMKALSDRGILCILLRMPFNLAVLDVNAADGIIEEYPHIESWYIGGHSLGGSMAASYIEKHSDELDGLVLLGSYSTADLSELDVDVLSIYGSEDKIMNLEKYEKYTSNLPLDFKETVINGGCHAYFGMYGEQKGDGTATITCAEQIICTAKEISQTILIP